MLNVLVALATGLIFGYYYGKVIDKMTMEGLNKIEKDSNK